MTLINGLIFEMVGSCLRGWACVQKKWACVWNNGLTFKMVGLYSKWQACICSKCGAMFENNGLVFKMTGSHLKWWGHVWEGGLALEKMGLCSNDKLTFEMMGLYLKWWAHFVWNGGAMFENNRLVFKMTGSHSKDGVMLKMPGSHSKWLAHVQTFITPCSSLWLWGCGKWLVLLKVQCAVALTPKEGVGCEQACQGLFEKQRHQ